MPAANEEARAYFDQLWQTHRPKWSAGEVIPATMQNGATVPLDFCLTTIARLIEQPQAPVEAVEAVTTRLRQLDNSQFIYPAESIHISLLGCTPRHPSNRLDEARIAAIHRACTETLKNFGPVKMSLEGLGIIGNQVFIQVLPQDRQWAEMRRKLEEALLTLGESPIAHPNKAPIHMNILRVTNHSKAELARLLAEIERLHATNFGDFTVSVIDFLITDFVVSPAHSNYISRIIL